MKPYKSCFKEETNSAQVIKDLIDLKDVNTDEEKGKFLSLIKGLIFANTSESNKFLTDINTFTSTLKIENYK
jgi:hypothetical protein